MAEKKNVYTICNNDIGSVVISDNVMSVIAGLAALEVEGIASMKGDIVASQITRSEMNKLSKCVKILVDEDKVTVHLILNIKYGYGLEETTKNVQKNVKDVLENMTGLKVDSVNISISDVNLLKEPKAKKTVKKNREKEDE